jgi:hypothetical protein
MFRLTFLFIESECLANSVADSPYSPKNAQKGTSKQTGNVRISIETRSCSHCCSGKAMSISYPECVLVALGIQHTMRMRHIVIDGTARSTTCFHIISKKARFS